MATFTIDSDNNITAHAELPAGANDASVLQDKIRAALRSAKSFVLTEEIKPGTLGAPTVRAQDEEELAEHMVFRPTGGSGFQVERVGEHAFVVRGRGIERLMARFDVDNEEAMGYLEGRLRRIGRRNRHRGRHLRARPELRISSRT